MSTLNDRESFFESIFLLSKKGTDFFIDTSEIPSSVFKCFSFLWLSWLNHPIVLRNVTPNSHAMCLPCKVELHYSHAGNLHGSIGYSCAPQSCENQNGTFCFVAVSSTALAMECPLNELACFDIQMTCWRACQEAVKRENILRNYGSGFKFTDLKEKKKAEPLKQYFGYNRHFWINRFGVLAFILCVHRNLYCFIFFDFV